MLAVVFMLERLGDDGLSTLALTALANTFFFFVFVPDGTTLCFPFDFGLCVGEWSH
jgi:hypothetical protein